MNFRGLSSLSTYACPNITDQFALNNSKAKLTYPIGLLTYKEIELMGKEFAYTGEPWWIATPGSLVQYAVIMQSVSTDGSLKLDFHNDSNGVRPAVSLKPGIKPSSGSGFKDDPYVVDKLN